MKNLVLILLFISKLATAAESGQNVSGQIQDNEYYENVLKEVDGDSEYLSGKENQEYKFGKSEDDSVKKLMEDPNYNKRITTSKDTGSAIPYSQENATQYLEHNSRDVFLESASTGRKQLAFGYYPDSYTYKDPRGVFQRTYRDSTGATKSGFLHFSLDKIFLKSVVELNVGGNIGFSLNQGKGHFAGGGNESSAEFSLWMIPVDLSLGLGVPLTSWFKAQVDAGPSAMGLVQNRSDKKDEERYKRRRQVGTGYFYEGKFSFSIARLIPSLGRSLFSEFNITQYFLTASYRAQHYSSFQDDFTVSGSSLGILMTFEYF